MKQGLEQIRTTIVLLSALTVATPVFAQEKRAPDAKATSDLAGSIATAGVSTDIAAEQDNALNASVDDLQSVQSIWARVYYSQLSRAEKLDALDQLTVRLKELRSLRADDVELIIWHGIVLSSRAGVDGGMSALKTVKRARSYFEKALVMDELALDGSAHLSIGSLYYQVPPWPIGFGSMKKARFHLKRALQINPDGIDPNFFYAGFLEKDGDLSGALRALRKALKAPARPGREAADAGRRSEVLDAIDRIEKKTLTG